MPKGNPLGTVMHACHLRHSLPKINTEESLLRPAGDGGDTLDTLRTGLSMKLKPIEFRDGAGFRATEDHKEIVKPFRSVDG